MKLTKVIIPAAGLGTRFLPFTKAVPKEMLPLGNLPAIHYILKEIVESGIHEIILVISPYKQAIKDYLSPINGTTEQINANGKTHLLDSLNELLKQVTITYVEQTKARGLGDAILQTITHCPDDFFGILLPDDIIVYSTTQKPVLLQLIEQATQQKKSILAVQQLPYEQISAYGCVAVKQLEENSKLFRVHHLVEKPIKEKAPSNLAIIGRYILAKQTFNYLKEITENHKEGEIQLTDALLRLATSENQLLAYEFEGERFDLGTPIGWLAANNKIMQLNR